MSPQPGKPFGSGDSRTRRSAIGMMGVGLIVAGAVAGYLSLQYTDWRAAKERKEAHAAAQERSQQQQIPKMETRLYMSGNNLLRLTPSMKPLADVPEGVDFRTDFQTANNLKKALYGDLFSEPLAKSELNTLRLEMQPKLIYAPWQMVKMGGEFHLRAYTLKRVSPEAIQTTVAAEGVRRGEPGYMPLTERARLQHTFYNSKETAEQAALDPNLFEQKTPYTARMPAGPQAEVRAQLGTPAPATAPADTGNTAAKPSPGMEGKVIQVTIPLSGMSGSFSASSRGQKARLSTELKALGKDAYKPFKLLPLAPPNEGGVSSAVGSW